MKKVKRYLLNCDNNPAKVVKQYYSIIPGNSNVMISAPHAYRITSYNVCYTKLLRYI